MELTLKARQTLIALCCKVAWADGVVSDEEKDFVFALLGRLGWDAAGRAEAERWLTEEPIEPDLAELPEALGQLAVYEALRLAEVDGELDDRELEVVRGLMDRVVADEPPETPIARIAIARGRGKPRG